MTLTGADASTTNNSPGSESTALVGGASASTSTDADASSSSSSGEQGTTSTTTGAVVPHPCGADPDDPRANQWVFLMLGQSNMAGSGACEPEDAMAPDRVLKLTRDLEWAPGAESFNINPFSSGTGEPCILGDRNVGPGRSMGIAVRDDIAPAGVTLHFVNAAVSGSAIESWDTTDPESNYAQMVPYLERALEDGVACGFVWHQGEANSGTEPEDYAAMLETIIAAVRSETGVPDLPAVVGEIGTTSDDGGVNQALALVVASGTGVAVATSEDLTLVDNIHYDAASQREYGRRYAAAWGSLLDAMRD